MLNLTTRTSVRRTGLALLIGGLLVAPSIAVADQTYTLKLHVNPGEKWSFDGTTTMKEKGQVLANGQVAQPIDTAMEQHRKGTIEIVEIDNGLPSAIVVSYDADSSNGAGAGGRQPPAFALAGKTVHVSRKDGIVTTDLGNDVDTPTVQEVSRLLDPDTTLYPKKPVELKEEWDGDTAEIAKAFQLGSKDQASVRCKLAAVQEVNGREIADVAITGTLVKHDQGFIETRIVLDGTSHIDVKSGHVLGSEIVGKITSRGSQQVPGPDGNPVTVSVSAEGTIDVRQAIRPLNAPVPVAPPVNPLAPEPAPANTPAFAGAFKGDHIALELTGDASQYSGTLTVGDKKFPCTGKADGAKLTGHFTSEGTSFDFTASIDGSTLTLTSDGSTYSLKKATKNPLARPTPRNPLAE